MNAMAGGRAVIEDRAADGDESPAEPVGLQIECQNAVLSRVGAMRPRLE